LNSKHEVVDAELDRFSASPLVPRAISSLIQQTVPYNPGQPWD